MNEITLGDLSTFVISLAALIGAASVIINALRKMKQSAVDKTVAEEVEKRLKPYTETLDRIDDNYSKISTEMTLLLQLNMALVTELQDGKVNGKTSTAMTKLNDYLIEQATKVN